MITSINIGVSDYQYRSFDYEIMTDKGLLRYGKVDLSNLNNAELGRWRKLFERFVWKGDYEVYTGYHEAGFGYEPEYEDQYSMLEENKDGVELLPALAQLFKPYDESDVHYLAEKETRHIELTQPKLIYQAEYNAAFYRYAKKLGVGESA